MRAVETGRRVAAQNGNDWGPATAGRAALAEYEEANGALDDFDRAEWLVGYGLAWAIALADNPYEGDAELAAIAAEATRLSLKATGTVGGWEAMERGEPTEASGQKAVA